MANITRIKASDTRKRHDLDDTAEAEVVTKVKATPKSKTETETAAKSKKQAREESAPQEATEQTSQKTSVAKNNGKNASGSKKAGDSKKSSNSKKVNSSEKAGKKAGKKHKTPKFIRVITKPFRAFGRYLRDSWGELRQVRWPSRKATWKLTLAVIVYCGILIAIIMGLDLVFTELFGWILG